MRKSLICLLAGLLLPALAAIAQASLQPVPGGAAELAAFRFPQWDCDGHANLRGRPRSEAERAAMERRVQQFNACNAAWNRRMLAAVNRLWTIPHFTALSTEGKKSWRASSNEAEERSRWYNKTRAFRIAQALALEDWIQPPTSKGLSKPDLERELMKVAAYFRSDCGPLPLASGPDAPQDRERLLRAAASFEACQARHQQEWARFKVHEAMSEGRWNLMSRAQLDRYYAFIDESRKRAAHLQASDRDQVRRRLSSVIAKLKQDPGQITGYGGFGRGRAPKLAVE